MSANHLLLYMSARGQGSWQQFRAAVEELHLIGPESAIGSEEHDGPDPDGLPLYQLLRLNLQRLGHAEFFAGASGSDWRIAPPSLGVTNHKRGSLAIVAGARSPRLMQRLNEAAGTLRIETVPLLSAPDQIRIIAQSHDSLATIAERANLFFQEDAATAILTTLPAIDNASVLRQSDLPIGKDWAIERFSTSAFRWGPVARENAITIPFGFFRFSLRHQRHFFLYIQGRAFQVAGQVGKFVALRHSRRKVFSYDANNDILSVPAICRPPFLIERALILCSGMLPSYDAGSGKLNYHEVDRPTAELACGLLRQELQ